MGNPHRVKCATCVYFSNRDRTCRRTPDYQCARRPTDWCGEWSNNWPQDRIPPKPKDPLACMRANIGAWSLDDPKVRFALRALVELGVYKQSNGKRTKTVTDQSLDDIELADVYGFGRELANELEHCIDADVLWQIDQMFMDCEALAMWRRTGGPELALSPRFAG